MPTSLLNSPIVDQPLGSQSPQAPPIEVDETKDSPENDPQEEPESGTLPRTVDSGNAKQASTAILEVDQLDPEDSDEVMGNSVSTITKVPQGMSKGPSESLGSGDSFITEENSSGSTVQAQRSKATSNQSSSSTTGLTASQPTNQTNNITPTTTTPESLMATLPSNIPRPFPLTSPQLSQILDEPTSRTQTPDGSNDSDSDSLPEVADMLARTRPGYSASQANQRRSTTARDDATRDIKMDVDNVLPRTPIKRHNTESPRIPRSPYKPTYNIVETPEKTIIEILDSDSDGGGPAPVKSKAPGPVASTSTLPGSSRTSLASPGQRIGTPKPKPKRKRTEPSGPAPSASVSASASQLPPSKRLKTGHGRYRKHRTHWHLDGNILVQIKNTRFKLQRSRLARHSEWFGHTFNRIDDDEKVLEWDSDDKVLYLDQTGVSVKDFETLLDAMDDAITFVYKTPPFRVMASILRASSSLSFNEFEQWASRYLEDMWSPDLTDLTTDRIPFATESIVLARHCNLLSILKRAMYELVRLEGFGQTETDSDDERDPNDAGIVELSSADFKAFVKARERLTSLWLLTATSPKDFPDCSAPDAGGTAPDNDPPLNQPNANGESADAVGSSPNQPAAAVCTSTNRTLSMQAHAKLVIDSGIYEEYHADPVCGFQALMDAPWAAEGFCEACVDMRRKAWASGREKAWENLGLWFGL